jgi:hypothetical protein
MEEDEAILVIRSQQVADYGPWVPFILILIMLALVLFMKPVEDFKTSRDKKAPPQKGA